MKKSIVLIGLVIAIICVFVKCGSPKKPTENGYEKEAIRIPVMTEVCRVPSDRELTIVFHYNHNGHDIYVLRINQTPTGSISVISNH